MAFQNKKLSVIAYDNGFTMWHYDNEGTENILIDGYFNSVKTLMNTGDIIICSGKNTFLVSVTIDKDVKTKKM